MLTQIFRSANIANVANRVASSYGSKFIVPYERLNNEKIYRRDVRSFSGFSLTDIETLMNPTLVGTSVGVASLSGVVLFANFRYKVSNPNQYLVRTGLGIKDMVISTTGFQWPFQNYAFINMIPKNYSFNLDAMSSQKMEFVLPGVFTIGPKDDPESLKKYCRYLLENNHDHESKNVDDLVKGIIEGETRVLAAQMTIEEIFRDRAVFKSTIIKNVQEELDQFGLQIFNANIKELQDTAGSEYFQYLRQKTRSEAEGQARIDMAEAKKNADIGEKERQAETRKQVAEFEAQAVEKENETKKRIVGSNALLDIEKADAKRRTDIANIEATKQASMRDTDLQKEVEQKKIGQKTEELRAVELTKANVDAEAIIRKSEGDAKSIEIGADADLYRQQKHAEADLYAQQKHAEGIRAVYEAQSKGINQLIDSFGGNKEALIQYLMLEKGLYSDLAKTNAEAIKGLNPKITVWNTNNGANSGQFTDTIRNVVQMIPPLFDTIHDQTGMKPAQWMIDGLGSSSTSRVQKEE